MRALSSLPDTTLVQMFISGNDKAFHELFRRYKPDVQKVVAHYITDKSLEKDLVQDAFVKVLVSMKSQRYREKGKFLPWVLRIAHNLCMDHLRKSARVPRLVEFLPDSSPSTTPLLFDQQIMEAYKLKQLGVLMELLPYSQRQVLYLRNYESMSYKDIADHMNSSVSTTIARMRYGLSNLRRFIKSDSALAFM